MNYKVYSLNKHKEASNSLVYKIAAQDIILAQLFKRHRK